MVAAPRLPGLSRWIRTHRNGVTDAAWMVFGLVNLDLIVMYPGWETIPFHFIWISLTLIYGFRTWKLGPTLWVLGGVMLLTAVGIAVAVRQGQEPPAELVEVPLMAMVFLAMVWHARRRLAAEGSYQLIASQIARILDRPAAVPAGRRPPAADPDHDRARAMPSCWPARWPATSKRARMSRSSSES